MRAEHPRARLEPSSRDTTAIRSMRRRGYRIQVWAVQSGGICDWQKQKN